MATSLEIPCSDLQSFVLCEQLRDLGINLLPFREVRDLVAALHELFDLMRQRFLLGCRFGAFSYVVLVVHVVILL